MHASDVHLRVVFHRHRRPPNPCGHALLFADGHYFHVAGAISRRLHRDELGYRRYLTESGKLELGLFEDAKRGVREADEPALQAMVLGHPPA
jgi:hypothetical protein